MRLYDNHSSGNAYKVRLLLALLGQGYERVEMDIDRSETRSESFLAINPNGRVPVLELDDGHRLAESNAILFYLAHDTQYLPTDRWQQAKVLQWMFFEQYSHEPYIAVSRFILMHLCADHPRRQELVQLKPKGEAALMVLERVLDVRAFLVGDRMSIADISLYAYTHVAHEGGFDLSAYPRIRAWITRVADTPGHISIDE